jgi:signal transduction histidine kinase
MPERLPRQLRILYELSRVVEAGPLSVAEVLERICTEVRRDFDFASVRFASDGGDRRSLLDKALGERRAVVEGGRVAVPLLVDGRCLGFLVADRDGAELGLGADDLDLLSAVGLLAGLFVAKVEQFEELQRALDELRRVDARKDEFVAVASHELRAPIAVVHGIAATLHVRGDELDHSQLVELRGALYEQSSRLQELTEQLLDLSRFDAGQIGVELHRFHPRDSVDGLLPRLAPDRMGDVTVEIDPRQEVVSDPVAFERVVGNLIANALKYGAPPVVVRAAGDGGPFRLFVEDRGPGVPPDFVPQLFERFTRADHGTRGGAGLGLAIARGFAEAVGANLAYEPAEPHGARFVLVLPTKSGLPPAARL